MTQLALVTGSSGFVGAALVQTLRAAGWLVRGASRGPDTAGCDEHVRVDLVRGVPEEAVRGATTVFHLAGKAHAVGEVGEDDAAYWPVNVDGTQTLLVAARAAGVPRFVYVSSVKATGPSPNGLPADESILTSADTPYGRSKRRAEQLVLEAGQNAAMHVAVLRPSLVYGPGVKGNLERMLAAVDHGRFPPVVDTGNRRSMVHVRDLAAALVLVATREQAAGRTYVVTDGRTYSTREIFEAMCRALDRPVPRWSIPVAPLRVAAKLGDAGGRMRGRRLPFDSTALERLAGSAWYTSARLRDELAFAPRYDLTAALPEMVAAYRARRPAAPAVAVPG